MLKKFMILQLISRFVSSAKFPSEITTCNYGETKCISDVMNDILANRFGGFPQLGLPSLDPLRIGKIDLVQNEKSPVAIVLNFKNISLFGLSKARVYKVNGFNHNPQGDKIDIRFKAPKIAIIGPYKTFGRVLVLPIQGDGICNMTLDEVDFTMRFQTKALTKNGKTFMQIDKAKMNFETSRLYIHLTNLFNGNEALGKNMNSFLNENWKDILDELKTPIVDSFGELFKAIISHVFNSFPYVDLFKN